MSSKDTVFNVIIETPKGKNQKYVYDEELKLFKLKKLLPLGMVFPYDFGFIPGTKGEDGDPLDIVVLWEYDGFPGCVIECRLIGAIKAQQKENGKTIRNDRFIVVATASRLYDAITSVTDLPKAIVSELNEFFVNYTAIEKKGFESLGILKADEAVKLIRKARAG